MFSFIKKLLFARELTFKEGEIILLGERVSIISVPVIAYLSALINEDPKLVVKLYELSKESTTKGFARPIKEKYKLHGVKMIDLLKNLSDAIGWGRIISISYKDLKAHELVGHVVNAPVGCNLKNQKKPVDHIYRGMIAACASIAFDDNIDVIETKCVACGSKYCEFVFKRHEEFLKEKDSNPLVKEQLFG